MNFLKYSCLRLGTIALAFIVCYYFGVGLVLSGLFAILIGFAVSYLAFPKLHLAASADIQGWLGRRRAKKPAKKTLEDENREIEDSYVDAQKRAAGEDF